MLVLAIGHSSRDTIRMLARRNIEFRKKNYEVISTLDSRYVEPEMLDYPCYDNYIYSHLLLFVIIYIILHSILNNKYHINFQE